MYYWESWNEDDEGNTANDCDEGKEQPLSVTDANDDELLDFAGYLPMAQCRGMSVHRDFNGRAYIKCNGALVAVVESTLLCDQCGAFEDAWPEHSGWSETCADCADEHADEDETESA